VSAQFPKFKKLHGPAADTQVVHTGAVANYRGHLPDEMLTE
jgi:hypothetical protein